MPEERWPLTTVAKASFTAGGETIPMMVGAGFTGKSVSQDQICIALRSNGGWHVRPVALGVITAAMNNSDDLFEAAFNNAPDACLLLAPYFEEARAISECYAIAGQTPVAASIPSRRIKL